MRPVPLVLGIVALCAAWISPLQSMASHAFYAHMTVHITVVAIAAPLLALAIAGGRWDPVHKAPYLFSPLLASVLELGVVWIWHTPALHSAARQDPAALIAEQATFLASGLLLWLAVFGGEASHRSGRSAEGIVALLMTAMHMTLLGALLALSPRPLYAHAHAAGLSPLDDQHLGGAIMILIGGVSYLAGGLWLSFGLLHPHLRAYR